MELMSSRGMPYSSLGRREKGVMFVSGRLSAMELMVVPPVLGLLAVSLESGFTVSINEIKFLQRVALTI